MGTALTDVPWGNLWRWVVSSVLFLLVIGVPLAFLTNLDTGSASSLFLGAVLLASATIAAIVVWSDDVPWIGDQ